MRATVGWSVLALVFLDELLAVAASGVVGWHLPGRLVLVWVLPVLAMSTWFVLASPRAAYGGPVVRPLAKVAVFGLAALGLALVGHPGWASALLVFSVVANGLAQLPWIAALASTHGPVEQR